MSLLNLSANLFGKADLHVHSNYSADALANIGAILKKAKELQLDIVAITDHDTIKGAKEALKIAPEFNIEVVVGQEIATKDGHLLALFIEKEIKPKEPLLETIREVHQQGGLAIVPHPGNWFVDGISFAKFFQIFNELDGIELLNGNWLGWFKAKESRKLNKSKFNLAETGGSDAHLASQVGCAYTLFTGKTARALYQSIKTKKTEASGNPWSYKERFLLLLNSPRIFYYQPTLPLKITYNIFKKGFQRIFYDFNYYSHSE